MREKKKGRSWWWWTRWQGGWAGGDPSGRPTVERGQPGRKTEEEQRVRIEERES